jgi:hypothetical protein
MHMQLGVGQPTVPEKSTKKVGQRAQSELSVVKATVLRRMYNFILQPGERPHSDLAGYICAGTASGGRLK